MISSIDWFVISLLSLMELLHVFKEMVRVWLLGKSCRSIHHLLCVDVVLQEERNDPETVTTSP